MIANNMTITVLLRPSLVFLSSRQNLLYSCAFYGALLCARHAVKSSSVRSVLKRSLLHFCKTDLAINFLSRFWATWHPFHLQANCLLSSEGDRTATDKYKVGSKHVHELARTRLWLFSHITLKGCWQSSKFTTWVSASTDPFLPLQQF